MKNMITSAVTARYVTFQFRGRSLATPENGSYNAMHATPHSLLKTCSHLYKVYLQNTF
jgi:hypothetical protein